MCIAVAADGPKMESHVEPVLGRADWFVIVEDGKTLIEAIQNPHRDDKEGCGVKVARMLESMGVKAVLSGNCGPKAALACRSSGTSISFSRKDTVSEAVVRYMELEETSRLK
ncbi:NifB/NifX family molybdenum-iron cluster-binding protein [Desulfovibrio ferrophilus]|uniref:Dinitrogenase iron-molybdenum cofactor biosynthesis domain-containing protein n=1 Tax=Desulfovibrio ferrophilus TaxID=241368 RepID=A0A2Z6B0Z8_9BACT|nr:NifB/NifX family molybdenum-iron cluster-binding protein [Desulfovibrio ferrophilus]BBD09076.1 uncharacterized protein DFE_2350 [Desulfovibrio ferrophilus]